MTLTVVTVCYNSSKTISRCIESVLRLNNIEHEYLIVDGESKDNTLEIIAKYRTSFEEKNIPLRVISEKDTGIYNAMNKAIDLANGDWIIYLNSDDYFYDRDSVAKILDGIKDNVDVLYGDVMVATSDRIIMQKPRDLERLKSGTEMPFCHQSTFVRRDILQKYRFDEKYKIIADIDSFLRMYEDGLIFKYLPICIAVFSNDGLSQTQRVSSIKEGKRLLMSHKCYGIDRMVDLNVHIIWYTIKGYLPKKLLRKIRQ